MLTVFGSIIVDNIFTVPSLPQQGETILATKLYTGPGGKGANQAVAASHCSANVAMVGSVGSDAIANTSLDSFRKAGVDIANIQRVDGPTGTAAVVVDSNGANAITVAPAANFATHIGQLNDQLLDQTSTLLMQMEIPVDAIEQAIFKAKKMGVRSILNLAPAAPLSIEALTALDIVIVNEVELEMLGAILKLSAQTHIEMAEKTAAQLSHPVLVTLGSNGAIYACNDGILAVPALDIKPVDTTGAGDTFCGVFTSALDDGMSIEDAMRRGCIAGSLACLKTGAQESQPTKQEIEQYL